MKRSSRGCSASDARATSLSSKLQSCSAYKYALASRGSTSASKTATPITPHPAAFERPGDRLGPRLHDRPDRALPIPQKLAGYTGLCPRVNQSGEKDRRGPITKHRPTYLLALVDRSLDAYELPGGHVVSRSEPGGPCHLQKTVVSGFTHRSCMLGVLGSPPSLGGCSRSFSRLIPAVSCPPQ
jgi:hypothetical protein